MRQYALALEKYLVTESGYFRLATAVDLGWGSQTESSYSVMVFQNKFVTRKFQ